MGVHIITLDMETAWDSKDYTLSKMGPISYIRDPRFYAQLLSVRVDRGPVQVFEHDEIPLILKAMKLEQSDRVVVGHNLSGFDALILSEIYGIHPRNMWDTIPMARWCGVARMTRESHAALTDWFKHGKKEAGTVVSDGKRIKEDFTPEEWSFFKQYCADDTLQCSENFYSMLPYMTPDALKFMSITARMATEPAFVLDRPALGAYIDELNANAEKARQEISHLFQFSTTEELYKALRSAQTFVSMLNQLGCAAPMKVSETKTEAARKALEDKIAERRMYGTDTTELERKLNNPEDYQVMVPALAKTDLEFLDLLNHPDPRVQQLVAMRLEHNSSGQMSRAKRFYDLSETGKPLPFMLKTFYAHTGRYGAGNSEGASDSTNMQNISKRNPNMLAIRKAIKAPQGYKVVAADSSQIEARMVAYLANEVELLDQFRHGHDPYAELAEKIFGATAQEIHDGAKSGDKRMKMYRNVGKTAILSCFAADTEVLTDKGWKPIVTVSETDKLWDGESWVNHEGLICNGKKNTVELAGVRVTPDHLIFDGSSWRTAAVLRNEPRYLKSAMLLAVEQSLIALWSNEAISDVSCTNVNVANAEHYIGTMDTLFPEENAQPLARIAAYVTELICGALHENTLTLKSDSDSGISQSSVVNEDCSLAEQTRTVESICHLFNATVVRNLSGRCKQILEQAGLHDVTCVRRNSRTLQDMDQTMSAAQSLFLTLDCESVTSNESIYADNGVKILRTPLTRAMEEEVLSFVSRMLGISYYTYPRLKAGMTLLSSSTVSTTMETTKEETYAWLHGLSNAVTDVLFHLYKQKTTNSEKNCSNSELQMEEVYDIRNAGPNHRFVVRSKVGWLWCHNCGYGVGWKKFSDTLLRQGVKLAANLDEHAEMAKHAHSVYRMSNASIVTLWDRCQRVIEALAVGSSGFFAGPHNDLLEYGLMSVPGASDLVPSIKMPNGYILRYPNLRAEIVEGSKRPQFYYDRVKGKATVKNKIYSGACAENISQSLAFMLLMWQACRMAEQGIHLHGNIHDSFAAIVPAEQAEQTAAVMTKCMSEVPDWLPGFPVACEAEIGDDFMVV